MAAHTIRIYFLLSCLFTGSISFIMATYVLFLTSRGLNLLEVNLINIVFMTTMFLAEVPTGAIADTWGRKVSFVLACLLLSAGMFVYYRSHSFWGFALAEATAAVGGACASGAFQAWVVDALRAHGYRGSLQRIFAREQQLKYVAGAAGAVAGAYLAERDLALPWLAGGITFLGTTLVAIIWMWEDHFKRRPLTLRTGIGTMREAIRQCVRYGRDHPAVRLVLGLGFFQAFAVQAPNMQWQIRFSSYLSHRSRLGWLWFGMSLALITGAHLAYRIGRSEDRDERRWLLGTQIGIGASILAAALVSALPPVVVFFLLHEVGRGMFRPLNDAYVNQHIPARERATLLSLVQMAGHVGSVLGLLVSGAVAQYDSIRAAWLLSGMTLALSAMVGLRNDTRKKES